MKHPILTRSVSLLLAMLLVLSIPAAYAAEVDAAADGDSTSQASEPLSFEDGTESTDENVENVSNQMPISDQENGISQISDGPDDTESASPENEPAVYVNKDGSYAAPEKLAVRVTRHLGDTAQSKSAKVEEDYTGVVAFYDYNETNEKTRLESPYFFYYKNGKLQDEDLVFYQAEGYLNLTDAPESELSSDEYQLVYTGEEVYVDENTHVSYRFCFNQSDSENGLFTGKDTSDGSTMSYTGGLPNEVSSLTLNTASGQYPTIRWDAVSGVSTYQVYRRVGSGAWSALSESITATTYTDTTATQADTLYFYFVVCDSNTLPSDVEDRAVSYTFQAAQQPAAASETSDVQTPAAPATEAGNASGNETSETANPPVNGASGGAITPVTPVVTLQSTADGVKISWPSDAHATGYRIYRRTGSTTKTLANISASTLKAGSSTVTYTDPSSGLTSGATYQYTVRTYYGTKSINSAPVSSSTDWSGYVYTSIVYVGIPQLKNVYSEATGMKLVWNAVPGAAGYVIYRRTSSTGNWTRLATATGTSYSDTTVASGKSYSYTVRAYIKSSSGSIIYGYWNNYTTLYPYHAAPSISVSTKSTGNDVTWTLDPNATGYRLFRKTGSTMITLADIPASSLSAGATTTSYTDPASGLTSGTTYNYTVRAYYGAKSVSSASLDASNNWSGYVYATVTYLGVPQLKNVYSEATGMKLAWTAVSSASGYVIYRRTSPTANWTRLATSTGTSYVDTTVTKGTGYSYTVRAYVKDSSGTLSYGYWENYTTLYTYHAAPSITAAIKNTGNYITWTLDPNAAGYRLFRKTGSAMTVLADIPASSLSASATTASYTDPASGLTSGTSYSYTVRAYYGSKDLASASLDSYNNWGGYVYASLVYLSTPQVASTATNESSGIKVKWTRVSGASGYYIYRRTGSASWQKVGSVSNGSTEAYIDTTASKLSAGTTCYYTIVAYVSNQASASYFDTVGACTVYLPAPEKVTVSEPTSSGTKLTWSAVGGATSYRVYRRNPNTSSWGSAIATVTNTSYLDASANSTTSLYFYTIVPCTTATINSKSTNITGAYDRTGYSTGILWSGKERSAWVTKNGTTYYVDKNGLCVTGWQYLTRNGKQYKYYFDLKTGALVTNLYSYFGKSYRNLKCRIVTCVNSSNSNPSYTTIYLYDSATDEYCIPAVSVRSVASKTLTKLRSGVSSAYIKSGVGRRWLDSNGDGSFYEQYACYITGTDSWFHSAIYNGASPKKFMAFTYNGIASNNNSSNGCIRLQCIYAYLIQDIVKNGYGTGHRIPVVLYKNTKTPGPFGVPKLDRISTSRKSDPTDPAITGKFFYATTVSGVSAKAGASAWTYY